MPFANVGKTRLYYRLEGKADRPVLVLSHSVGTDHGMWAPQAAALLPHFQVLRYDTRGHGASDVPQGEYSIEQLGSDAVGLVDALGISKFAFCGLSLGGAIGQWIARNAPERVTALVLANTSPRFGPRENWENRIRTVREGGMASIVDLSLGRFFSVQAASRNSVHVLAARSILLGMDPLGYTGCCAVLRDFDSNQWLREIRVATLVIGGDRDISTPWEGHGEVLAREIPGARSVVLPAAHISTLECPRSFTAALLDFLRPAGETGDPLEAGTATRRALLGDAHVDRAVAATNDFNREFQSLITRYAWGTIWTRPGLGPRTRRLLVLSMMASLGRWEEFRLHLSAGLAHELESCDVKEMLLQTAIYAGVPAANTAFHIANEEIEKARAGQTGAGQG